MLLLIVHAWVMTRNYFSTLCHGFLHEVQIFSSSLNGLMSHENLCRAVYKVLIVGFCRWMISSISYVDHFSLPNLPMYGTEIRVHIMRCVLVVVLIWAYSTCEHDATSG